MSTAVTRVLTGEQLTAVLAGIRASTIRRRCYVPTVYDALLSQDGRSLADHRSGWRIRPDAWQIPSIQWDAIVDAASARAQAWGTDAQLRADLLDRMLSVFDDATAPTSGRRSAAAVRVRPAGDCYLVGNPSGAPGRLGPRRRRHGLRRSRRDQNVGTSRAAQGDRLAAGARFDRCDVRLSTTKPDGGFQDHTQQRCDLRGCPTPRCRCHAVVAAA
jgi:hypothetical protein